MSIESVNERELLSAAMQGSQIAYRELIHLHQPAVYRFAWAMIGDEDAQTVTENAFITAWRQLDYLQKLHITFREHLFHLVCIDCAEITKHQHRHRINLPAAQDDETLNFAFGALRYDPRTNMEHLALQTDIEEALRALPLRFRQVLLLHEMGDLADTQIADITGDDAQTVHSYLERSRAFLRRQIILSGGFFPIEASGGDGTHKWRACKEYIPSLAAAADNLCTTAEKQMLTSHMATCPGCQGYYDSLCAINHGIAVMKREVPGDMASYIIHRIQQEDGKGDFAAPGEKPSHRPRFAFGRFSIIGLCIALVLLAYSGGILDRNSSSNQEEQRPPAQTQEQTPPPVQQENDPDSEDPGTEESGEPFPSENGSSGDPDTPDGGEGETQDTPSVVPGGEETGGSDTLVPAGETYAAVSIVDGTGSELLEQYSSLSFRANLAGGRTAMYYIVPAENAEALDTALSETGVDCTAHTDEPDAIDSAAPNLLYIIYLS